MRIVAVVAIEGVVPVFVVSSVVVGILFEGMLCGVCPLWERIFPFWVRVFLF